MVDHDDTCTDHRKQDRVSIESYFTRERNTSTLSGPFLQARAVGDESIEGAIHILDHLTVFLLPRIVVIMSNSATETTPLLPKSKPLKEVPPIPIEPGRGSISENLDPSEDGNQTIDDSDENNLERQATGEDRSKLYDGMPEVRKLMKYIFPAIAIGVFLAAADQTIVVSSYGKIGSELQALNKTSWIATASVCPTSWENTLLTSNPAIFLRSQRSSHCMGSYWRFLAASHAFFSHTWFSDSGACSAVFPRTSTN
jgi:hypothetical protein